MSTKTIYRLETSEHFWNFTALGAARKFRKKLPSQVKPGAEFKEIKEQWNGKKWVRKERVVK